MGEALKTERNFKVSVHKCVCFLFSPTKIKKMKSKAPSIPELRSSLRRQRLLPGFEYLSKEAPCRFK